MSFGYNIEAIFLAILMSFLCHFGVIEISFSFDLDVILTAIMKGI